MAWAQSGANSDPTYVALRNIGLGSEVVQVTNFDLKRDAGTFRLNSGTGIARRLIYPKGAYVLHMIRMMMWDQRTKDDHFKETMKDFVQTFANRVATTEDFKAVLEKHMLPQMNLTKNGKMDWFFDDYVYGTQLPSYQFTSSLETNPDHDVVLSFKLTQSNVGDHFRMLVPVYLELADGRVVPVQITAKIDPHRGWSVQ